MSLIELSQASHAAVRPLLGGQSPGVIVALDALRHAASRVLVDREVSPTCALILSPTGWHAAIGRFREGTAAAASRIFLSPEARVHLETFKIQTAQLVLLGDGFTLDNPRQQAVRENQVLVHVREPDALAPFFEDPQVADLTVDGYREALRFSPMLRKFWPEPEALVATGSAKMFVEDGRVSGICFSCFVSEGQHEAHIVVEPALRRRGLGKRLAAAYAARLVRRGQRVFWSCLPGNQASARIAAATGFKPHGQMPLLQYYTAV